MWESLQITGQIENILLTHTVAELSPYTHTIFFHSRSYLLVHQTLNTLPCAMHCIRRCCCCCCWVTLVVSDSVRPHRRQPTRMPCLWDSPGKNTGVGCHSFSNAWKWKVKVKWLSHVWPSATPWTAAFQAPPSMGFSRQEYWSGVPLPSSIRRWWYYPNEHN